MTEDDFHKQKTNPGAAREAPSKQFRPEDIPVSIGPYKIESLLETGGMSVVYLGTHPKTKDPVTIKVLLPKYLSNPDVMKRFLKEAEIISMADHPNIVKMYGYGEWEKGLYIAMEFIQGISLRQFIQHNPISLKKALEITLDIAYALCHLHTHGVIHRDLKPENILMTETGGIKVIDFGIAQLMDEKNENDPNKPRFAGTPFYMSPEQKENPDLVSFPSDIYSLGIIVYELAIGKLSYGQIHLSLLPKGLQKILTKALQPNIEDRYQDAVDFIGDLSAYLNSENIHKEKKGSDQLSEISEQLLQVQTTLTMSHAPQWDGMEIGLLNYKGISFSGIFYDFFNLPDGKYGIILTEPAAKGVGGVIYTAVLRGMIKSLIRLSDKPAEVATLLNDLIVKDSINQIFTLSYLVLDPKQNQFHYISCGYGDLWYNASGIDQPEQILAENIALGVDQQAEFLDVEHSWNPGDMLILNNFAHLTIEKEERGLSENFFRGAMIENMNLPAQKQTEAIFRKIKIGSGLKHIEDNPILIISIHRI